jgi:hypothetical protein
MTMAGDLRAHADLADYYERPAVRARIAEFFGVRPDGSASATGAAEYGGVRWVHGPEDAPQPRSVSDLAAIQSEGADVLRTLSDDRGTLLVLDVDFVHPSDPAEPWREPARCFARIRHAHEAALEAFARHGVVPLVLLNVAGYRYLARLRSDAPLYRALAVLGAGDGWAATTCRRDEGSDAAAAHRGAGRLVEFLAHEVVRAARAAGPLPVSLGDVPPAGPDAFVRVDPCAYADAPEAVHLRSAFSSDQNALVRRPGAPVPFVIVLPSGGQDAAELLATRIDLARAASYAETARAAIPDVREESHLLRAYERSALAAFHAEMDHAPLAADWARSPAGLFDAESAAPCASAVLRYPAPRLLQPRHLRTVALTLWSTGWHPRTVAALVGERYQEPHDWGTHWQRHDPARTAAYFVRLFCAAAACGLDDGLFTCETQARHALCPAGGCGYDLGLLFRRLRTLRARDEAHA